MATPEEEEQIKSVKFGGPAIPYIERAGSAVADVGGAISDAYTGWKGDVESRNRERQGLSSPAGTPSAKSNAAAVLGPRQNVLPDYAYSLENRPLGETPAPAGLPKSTIPDYAYGAYETTPPTSQMTSAPTPASINTSGRKVRTTAKKTTAATVPEATTPAIPNSTFPNSTLPMDQNYILTSGNGPEGMTGPGTPEELAARKKEFDRYGAAFNTLPTTKPGAVSDGAGGTLPVPAGFTGTVKSPYEVLGSDISDTYNVFNAPGGSQAVRVIRAGGIDPVGAQIAMLKRLGIDTVNPDGTPNKDVQAYLAHAVANNTKLADDRHEAKLKAYLDKYGIDLKKMEFEAGLSKLAAEVKYSEAGVTERNANAKRLDAESKAIAAGQKYTGGAASKSEVDAALRETIKAAIPAMLKPKDALESDEEYTARVSNARQMAQSAEQHLMEREQARTKKQPQPTTSKPSRNAFIAAARQANPGYSDAEIILEYNRRYGAQ